jgi:hypothetical protein
MDTSASLEEEEGSQASMSISVADEISGCVSASDDACSSFFKSSWYVPFGLGFLDGRE